MPELITPRKLQLNVKYGIERLSNYRKARAMFIRESVGQYYRDGRGLSGDQAINLLFHTIRSMVPNLVMQSGVNDVITRYVEHQEYAELLGLGLDSLQEQIKMKPRLRAWIVDAIFGFGVMKSGISTSGSVFSFDDVNVDPGQIYSEVVDLDNFVMDAVSNSFDTSDFLGDIIRVPRQTLLESEGFNKKLVEELPSSRFYTGDGKRVEDLTKDNSHAAELYAMQDMVDVVELWIPGADATVVIPDPRQTIMDDYLKVGDYYGPKEGPYSFLTFTAPVPNNPLPVAPVSIWYDIHKAANRIFEKVMAQADNQKDILLYPPAMADEAQDVLEADDGDSVACTDPKSINVVSFGGQNKGNDAMLSELQMWYNYMAGNPDQMAGNMTAGTKGSAETATRSQIMQSNASIVSEDYRDILYDGAADISGKQAWYLHTDPMIELPLTKRSSGGKMIQLVLTPEQRQGDFLDFTFRIQTRSMSRLDPVVKSKRLMDYCINVIPAVMNAAMVASNMGVEFNPVATLTDLAKEMDITEHVTDWFSDPNFMNRMAMMAKMGPQNQGKAGNNSNEAVLQQGGFPGKRPVMDQGQINNQNSQATAADSQSMNQGVY